MGFVFVEYTRAQIEEALALNDFDGEEAQRKMIPRPRGTRPAGMPGKPREGGVLVVLYSANGHSMLVLTKRRDDLQIHAGQISFPGGRRENGESLRETALREAREEIGLDPADLSLLGELTPLYIPPTDYEVHPFVAWLDEVPRFQAQQSEVEKILEVPIPYLMDSANRFEEPWDIRGFAVQVPYFLVDGYKVWGATAMMLSELLERLRGLGD